MNIFTTSLEIKDQQQGFCIGLREWKQTKPRLEMLNNFQEVKK